MGEDQQAEGTDSRIIAGESLRTRMSRVRLGKGIYSDPEPFTDLRGAPIGDVLEVWAWERLVLPHRSAKRRIRERIEAMHCPEGWYSRSGSAAEPMGPATCSTILTGPWGDRHAFNAFHRDHPVVWRVMVTAGKQEHAHFYCDPELPAEYRPSCAQAESNA